MWWLWMRRWPAGPGSRGLAWAGGGGGWAGQQLAAQQALSAAESAGGVLVKAGRREIAIDGKTLRGSAPRATPEQAATAAHGGGRTHLVSACDPASGVALGQVACSPEA